MLTEKSFKRKVEDLGYSIVIDEDLKTFQIIKKSKVYAEVGFEEQFSTTFSYTPANLKNLVRDFEDTKIDKRTGWYLIPLKGLDAGGQKYIFFNKVTEKFGASDLERFAGIEDIVIYFRKEDLESDLFRDVIGDYLKYVEEA